MRLSACVVVLILLLASRPSDAATLSTFCGVIRTYAPATATAAGSITIGTRTIAIAPGTTVKLVNAPPRVGPASCVSGTLDTAGAFTDLGDTGFPSGFCGTVTSFTPATSSTGGALTFGTSGTATFLISAGTALPAAVASGRHCVSLGVNAAGDAIATAEIAEPPVQLGGGQAPSGVAATSPNGATSAATLPSTATEADRAPLLIAGALLVALAAVVCTRVRRVA